MNSNIKKNNATEQVQANENCKPISNIRLSDIQNKSDNLIADETFSNEFPLLKDSKRNHFVLKIILLIVVLFYGILLFWNIPYPLFWADEGLTVMEGERVAQFGYPKLHDGKNVLYDLQYPDVDLGKDKKTDAFIGGTGWLHYYVAAPFTVLSKNYKDFYVKTTIMRVPFAIIGSLGLLLFLLSMLQFLKNKSEKLLSSIIFVVLCEFSVPLLLHLREVRYYSLTIFFFGFLIYLITKYRIQIRGNKYLYLLLLTIVLILQFFSFSPGYFISLGIIASFEILNFIFNVYYKYEKEIKKSQVLTIKLKENIIYLLPLIASFIILIPFFSYFRIFEIAQYIAKYYHVSYLTYFGNFEHIIRHYATRELLIAAFLLKVTLIFITPKLIKSKNQRTISYLKLSYFYLIAYIVYILLISNISYYVFIRYFVASQPILTLMIIIDLIILLHYFRQRFSFNLKLVNSASIIISTAFFVFYLIININLISGKLYETFNKFKNTLDYSIKFVDDNFAKSDTLIIATNYEETSWMYYLNCKVIVGFAENNIQEDSMMIPDIIVYRKWSAPELKPIFKNYLQKANYQSILLPCFDDGFNCIPEIGAFNHLFKVRPIKKDEDKLQIYIRKDILVNKKLKF